MPDFPDGGIAGDGRGNGNSIPARGLDSVCSKATALHAVLIYRPCARRRVSAWVRSDRVMAVCWQSAMDGNDEMSLGWRRFCL